jgi:AAA domain
VSAEPEFVDFSDETLPLIADEAWLTAQLKNGDRPVSELRERPWRAESWETFRDTADEETRWMIEGLLPAGSFAFVAAPPKKGKTWLALGLTLSIATGRPLFGEYVIPEPLDCLYVALEGSRSALRARTGSLARGMGLNPDAGDLSRLAFLYRPRPFDLARPDSAEWLLEQQQELGSQFVVIDVLRAAARFRENVAEDFAVVRDAFEPMLAAGVTIAVLHHFGKLTDTQRDRSPGERMAGTGAMYGALDVGFLITQSTEGARRLRVDIDARDFAAPEALGIVLHGTGTAEHGGFRYDDVATFELDAGAAMERDLVHELEQLFADGVWRTVRELADANHSPPNAPGSSPGIGANIDEIRALLKAHPDRFVEVAGDAVGRRKNARPWGSLEMDRNRTRGSESVESVPLFGAVSGTIGNRTPPLRGVGVRLLDDPETDSESESVSFEPSADNPF